MNQKGFIQIPLLVAIIVATISAASIGTGVVLFKQQKTPAFTANISDVIYKTFYEKKFEAEQLKQELELSKFREEKSEEKAEEELTKRVEAEGARAEAEGAREEAEGAREEAEERAQQEAIKRAQEEMVRKAKEQELATKEAQEKMMSADNDGDGLTYRRELELGTSDWNTDSDGDGINDGEDLHPAGGGRNLAQHFEWEYQGEGWEWNYSIHEDWYEYYKNKPRTSHGLEYITEDDPFIQKIAKALKEGADKKNYHLTLFIVSFVQGLPYVEDYYTTFDDYPKYPIETFVERNGDCEDTSYLFASLAQATGRAGASLVEFHNHMGVGIKTAHSQSGYYYPIGDAWYYYYETTGKGWKVGDLPSDYLYENAKITRIWDGSVHYSYPKYIKPCYASSVFSGYYSDGENFYSDSQCNNSVYCIPYKGYYVNPQITDLYWDSGCSQKIVKGCYKSKNYPSKFYKSGSAWYYDSQCTQTYKSMICTYPSSSGYMCTSESTYNLKKSYCDYYRSSRYLYKMAEECEQELAQCRSDINEYQTKLNEYNQCKDNKEY